MPSTLMVTSRSTAPTAQLVRIQYRLDKPIKILSVESDFGKVDWEQIPTNPVQAGSGTSFHQLRITLPGFADLPEKGGKLTINTDDQSDEFKHLEIPVVRRDLPARPPQPIQPGARGIGTKPTPPPAPGTEPEKKEDTPPEE